MNKIKNLIALNLIFFLSLNLIANDDPFEDFNRKIWTFNEFLDDNFAKPAAEIYTCLLYTSPSPRDRTRSRMPSSA